MIAKVVRRSIVVAS